MPVHDVIHSTSVTVNKSTAPLQFIDGVFKTQDTGEAYAEIEANKAAGNIVCVVESQ